MIRRNTASQVIYFPQLKLTADGSAVTISASLVVSKDGTESASAGTLTHYAGGVWKYTPTQAETNCAIMGLILTATAADTIVLNLITTGADTSAVALGANTTTPPTAAANASQVRTELTTELGRIDTAISTRSTYAGADTSGVTELLTRIPDATPGAEGGLPVLDAGLSVLAELDSAARSALLLAMVTEDTGETAAADGSPAKLAQGGVSTVNILPAVGIVASRSPGVTLLPVVGETISQSITVYETDGTTAVDLSGKTLAIVFETMSGVDVAVVDNADITVSGLGSNVVTFAYPSAVTATERVLRFALRDAAAPLAMYLQGVCSVVSAPKVDA